LEADLLPMLSLVFLRNKETTTDRQLGVSFAE